MNKKWVKFDGKVKAGDVKIPDSNLIIWIPNHPEDLKNKRKTLETPVKFDILKTKFKVGLLKVSVNFKFEGTFEMWED
jgi:hypothetical protein